ncbi:MAG: hypothetical protein LQ337_004568 [Flavoplaca oasis]|nr:MAG: hypothetical protein LQ337_004568 [Flavoplaca oasis]
MYLHLSLLLTLTGLLFQSSFAQKNRVDSGHYIIVYCGAGPDSKAAKLQTLLPQIHEKLQIVLADVKKGVASKAFNAYFKTNDSIAHVESIFQKIAAGAAVRVPVQGAPSGFTVPYSPMIVCVDPTTPGVDDLREKCKGVTAASNPNTQHMILCDDFWTHLATKQFPQVKGCPKVKYNRFHPDDYRVMFNQFGTFVHEFAHTYTSTWVQEETYHPTAAVQLSAEESLKNPQNFALYAASVVAGCTKYVEPDRLRDNEELKLEITEGDIAEAKEIWAQIAAEEAAEPSEEDADVSDSPLPLMENFEPTSGNTTAGVNLAELIPESPAGTRRRRR